MADYRNTKMYKLKILIFMCLAFYLIPTNSYASNIYVEEGPNDAMANVEDDLDDLLEEATSADMCPIPMCKPSLVPKDFDLQYYVNELRHGDLNTVISLMTKLTSEQRQQVNQVYFEETGKYIQDSVTMRGLFFTRSLELALKRLFQTPEEIFADDLHYELHTMSVNVGRVTEILFTVNNYGLLLISEAYGRMFSSSIKHDIQKRLRFNPLARNLLMLRAEQGRKERKKLNEGRAAKDAAFLYNNRSGVWEPLFNKRITKDSADQLHLLFDTLEETYGISIEKFINTYAATKIRSTYLDIVKMIKNPYLYLAKRLFDTMNGLGTDNRDLIRIVIGRGEIDLASIEDAFNNELPEARRKGKNLRQCIKDDIHLSKKYGRILAAILQARATL